MSERAQMPLPDVGAGLGSGVTAAAYTFKIHVSVAGRTSSARASDITLGSAARLRD